MKCPVAMIVQRNLIKDRKDQCWLRKGGQFEISTIENALTRWEENAIEAFFSSFFLLSFLEVFSFDDLNAFMDELVSIMDFRFRYRTFFCVLPILTDYAYFGFDLLEVQYHS